MGSEVKMKGAFRITDKLTKWIELKNWTQTQLAEALSCDNSEISQWCVGKTDPKDLKNLKHPSWQLLRKLCLLTGLDISELLTFDRNIEQED
jgi:transcriptional regulator with XRE-family HTH domain